MSRDGFGTLHSNGSACCQPQAVSGPGGCRIREWKAFRLSLLRLARSRMCSLSVPGGALLSPFPRCLCLSWGAADRTFLFILLQTLNCPGQSMVVAGSPQGWRRISRGEQECPLTPGSALQLNALSSVGTFPWLEGPRICLTYFFLFSLPVNLMV